MLCSKLLNVKKIKSSSEIENKYISTLTYLLKKKYYFLFYNSNHNLFRLLSFEKFLKNCLQEDRGAFFMVLESPEGNTYQNTVTQMLEGKKKLLEFNQNKEAKKNIVKSTKFFWYRKL